MSLIIHPNGMLRLCVFWVGYPGTRHFSTLGTRFQNFGKVEALFRRTCTNSHDTFTNINNNLIKCKTLCWSTVSTWRFRVLIAPESC